MRATDRAALRLQRDLRAAETIGARLMPTRDGHEPIGRAAADDERVERRACRYRVPLTRMHRASAEIFQTSVSGK